MEKGGHKLKTPKTQQFMHTSVNDENSKFSDHAANKSFHKALIPQKPPKQNI